MTTDEDKPCKTVADLQDEADERLAEIADGFLDELRNKNMSKVMLFSDMHVRSHKGIDIPKTAAKF